VLALVPLLRNRSEPVRVASEDLAIPIRPNLAYAAFLGLIAASLRRRTRLSWWIVVLLYFGPACLGSLAAGFTAPLLFISAAILLALLVVTIRARREFTAKLPPGNGWRALLTLVVGLTIAGGLGYLLVLAFPGTLHGTGEQAGWAVDHVFGGLGSPESLSIAGRPAGIVTFLCGLFGALAFLTATWVLFRPRRGSELITPAQEGQLRELLSATGERDSLGYFATRRDKAVIFSPSGKAAVTYRVVFGTSLASGDPIGDPEAWGPAIETWVAQARHNAWAPGVLGASEEGALAYQRAGLDALQPGDEAIIEVGDFDLDGGHARRAAGGAPGREAAGYRCRCRHRHPAAGAGRGLRAGRRLADTEDERGFSMALGRLGDPADGQCPGRGDRRARRAAGDPLARAVGSQGLSLDLMRRDRDSDNGLVEFMVVQLVQPRGGSASCASR
jgi:lysyl-tRNA synthetase class 2